MDVKGSYKDTCTLVVVPNEEPQIGIPIQRLGKETSSERVLKNSLKCKWKRRRVERNRLQYRPQSI